MPYVQEFQNAEDLFVAIGTDVDFLIVYQQTDQPSLVKTKMTFPGCLRFLPYAEDRGSRRMTDEEITKAFGPMVDEFGN